MPLYVFRNARGNEVDVFFPVDERPHIGEEIEIDGQRYTRVTSFHIDAGVARKVHKYPFVSESLPKGWVPDSEVKTGPRKGKPIIRSQQHEKEVLAKTGYQRM